MLLATAPAGGDDLPIDPPADQASRYQAEIPKTIVELQQFRRSWSGAARSRGRQGVATLVELNPYANAWFLLTLDWGTPGQATTYHLESADPAGQILRLAGGATGGLAISGPGGSVACELWSGNPSPLEQARSASLPYAPLCGGRLYLHNRVAGSRTELESVTDFLRSHVWGGERIVTIVRQELFADAFREEATPGGSREAEPRGPPPPDAPRPASLANAYAGLTILPTQLGIDVAVPEPGELALGRWYPVRSMPGVHVSAIQPQAIAPEILARHGDAAGALDGEERTALDYLVAFDLASFDLGFVVGTDHPRVDWSDRVPEALRNLALPGPDGIGSVAPLVPTGMVGPTSAAATVATFIGGFKRTHGAFRYGDLAARNHGSHYGFIEQGVVFSKLQPGLATLYVLDDGSVDMKTWTEADDRQLARIRFARQNGVALVELDPVSGTPVPGPLVGAWGLGNWSGSAEGDLRSIRAGACLQESPAGRFLLFGFFSTATPSAMARVFQAYGCRYAMLLDMNALEHTYLALYVPHAGGTEVQHLIKDMSVLDRQADGRSVPRFLAYPDNRDFFYLVRREERR